MQKYCLRKALTASFVGSGILGYPSLALDGCPSCLVLRLLLMKFHRFSSFFRSGSGGGRIARLMVGFSRVVVFPLNFSNFSKHCFSFFERCACGTGVRGLCTLINRQHGRRMQTKSHNLFASYRPQVVTSVTLAPRLLWCVFFPRKMLKSFSDGRSNRSVAGSHNQIQLCRLPGGSK